MSFSEDSFAKKTRVHFLQIPKSWVGAFLALFCFFGQSACSDAGDHKKTDETQEDFALEAGKNIVMKLSWTEPPIASKFLTAQLLFELSDKSSITSAQISRFKPWMTSMGHGGYEDEQKVSPDPAVLGSFKVENVYFTMPGAWDIEVSAIINGKTLFFSQPIDVGA